MAERLVHVEAETLIDKLNNLDSKHRSSRCRHLIQDGERATLLQKGPSGDKWAEVAEALVNTVANRLGNVNGEKLLARLSDVRAKTLVAVLADTITDVQKRHFVTKSVTLKQKRFSTRWLAYKKRCKPKNLFLYTSFMVVQP